MRLFSAACFIGLAGCAACRRLPELTWVEGRVLDRHTGQSVANATVEVTGIVAGLGAGGTFDGGHFRADAQGRFGFSFPARPRATYTLLAATSTGYASEYGDAPLLHTGRRNKAIVVRAAAPAWVRIVCLDDPPASRAGLTSAGYDGMGDNQTIGPGNYSFVRPIGSHAARSVYCRLLNSQGEVQEFRLPVQAAGFDTVTVTVHF